MKCRIYGISLIVFVSVLAALVLRSHVPMTTAKEGVGITAIKSDVTATQSKVTNRSHLTALTRASQTQLLKTYGKLPLSFETNHGQTDSQVQFLARGGGYTLFLTSTEAVLSLHGSEASTRPRPRIAEALQAPHSLSSAAGVKLGILPLKDGPALLRHGETRNLAQRQVPSRPEPRASAVLRMKMVGANPSPRVAGLNELPGKSNYFLGKNRKKWRTNVPIYAKVKYDSVYPGVDLVYYGNQGQLEYDFVVGPGADPRAIKFALQGATKVAIDTSGDLVAELDGREMRLHKPLVYQPEEKKAKLTQHNIDGNYVLTGDNQVGFRVSAYDPQKALVIDPVLKYSTYLGGSGDDWGSVFNFIRAIGVDPRGNAYVIGTTDSIDFPTADAYQKEFAGGGGGLINPFGGFAVGDAFVAKLNAAGKALVYSTYLGGTGDDYGEGIAVDAAGNAYLAGMTDSTDFPTMNPIQTKNAGLADMFVAKLNATGSALVYSTYLGGSDSDGDPMIALDSRGNLYFEAWTFSTDITTANPFQAENAGASDIWAGKLNAAGNALIYSTYLGGSDFDICGSDIVVDPAGNNYLNGVTCSTDFPTVNPIQPENAGSCDAFLTKLNANGNALIYSTYLGGNGDEITLGTAVDAAGDAYVTGGTSSSNFPTVNPIQAAYAGNEDGFVAKVNRNGTALVYSTYLGGTDFDFGRGIVVDAARNSYIVGGTSSTDFPTANPLQAANAGDEDVFLTKLNRTGNALVFSTFLGGSSWEEPSGIALGPSGDAYLQGTTASSDFPVVKALQPANAGGLDAFVARIRPTTVSDTSLSPLSGAARVQGKKGGTTMLKYHPYAWPFARRVRPGR
jgi:Beta-propeller repeat